MVWSVARDTNASRKHSPPVTVILNSLGLRREQKNYVPSESFLLQNITLGVWQEEQKAKWFRWGLNPRLRRDWSLNPLYDWRNRTIILFWEFAESATSGTVRRWLLTRLRPLGHEIIINIGCKKEYNPLLLDQIDASQLRYFDCHGTWRHRRIQNCMLLCSNVRESTWVLSPLFLVKDRDFVMTHLKIFLHEFLLFVYYLRIFCWVSTLFKWYSFKICWRLGEDLVKIWWRRSKTEIWELGPVSTLCIILVGNWRGSHLGAIVKHASVTIDNESRTVFNKFIIFNKSSPSLHQVFNKSSTNT